MGLLTVPASAGTATAAAPAVVPVTAAAGPCDAGGNPITCENSQPGTPKSQWDIDPKGTVEGYGDQMSVNLGQTINFKIRSAATALKVDVYRMGYYQGNGARFITTVPADTAISRNQPGCPENTTTGMVECAWGTVASWSVPTTMVSGIYFAHVVRTDAGEYNGDDTHIVFVVRDDARQAKMLFKTSDSTWQAYNSWGDVPATENNPWKAHNSFYRGDSLAAPGRAAKLSYNRPFNTRYSTPWGRDFVWANEYPMVRFLEANGYDVAYIATADAGRTPQTLLGRKAILSVGHDEYWSGEERAAFEAARDAGVNLAFFSGNEVYWKTRWENGHRTLVAYKETLYNAKTDPEATWTGTWRDPRFSPPSDGGRPENALTGTFFTVNCTSLDNGCRATGMKVPAADGKMRFWRGTPLASQPDGTSTTLPGILGYEWDEDIDNGHRPPGLVPLSKTTETVDERLIDFGSKVAVQEATHKMTMYRASSGALVFGAGTVQWSWGLDDEHDGDSGFADDRIKQATVNLFADMDVQPMSLRPGLSSAAKSTDAVAPTAAITAPASGATLENGSTVTISGTAADTGGEVGAVEVSTDGGQTWHPANGRGTWTYSWEVAGAGTVQIQARAADDSGNLGTPVSRDVTVECPCSLFPDSATPANPAENDSTALELGTRFRSSVPGYVTGIRFYKGAGNTGTHTGTLWTADGQVRASGTFGNETETGWQTLKFAAPVHIPAGTDFIVTYFAPNGHYASDANFFRYADHKRAPLTAPKATQTVGNGVYRVGPGFPNQTFNGGNYYVDPIFEVNDTFPPAALSATPVPGSSSVPVTTQPKVVFAEPVQAGTATMEVKDAADNVIAGTATLDAGRTTLTFAPAAPLAAGTTFTVRVSGAVDDGGNAMEAPYSFTFKTVKVSTPGVCPCSLWSDGTVPAVPAVADTGEVELGLKFQADSDGYVNGIRFYKGPGNTGTHTGTLWNANGGEIVTGTFSDESTQGWQELLFPSPVGIDKNTTYVVSYHAPNGRYAATYNGLASQVTASPLRAPASGSISGNGVYRYGPRAFPNSSWAATNYYVDVIFTKVPDTQAPTVAVKSPAHASTGVPTGTAVTATFSEPVQEGTPVITVKNPANQTVAGTATLNAARTLLTFTPSSPLAQSTVYSVTVSGAEDDAGNAMISTSWSFTTGGAASCPCSIWPSSATPASPVNNDATGIELGVKFTADMDGEITGIRFYKAAGDTGTHYGSLWTAGGSPMRGGTFVNETASGWQTLIFDQPVEVTAGEVYVASYHSPNGYYAASGGYFNSGPYDNAPLHALANGGPAGANGLYRYTATPGFPVNSYNGANYWVDVIFVP
ncbi:methionine-rich copper-binding protein CopC [Thermocatellispora tengchongensis]|uniref:Methionine-rich copper-binding protein CopC n=1 Tax=Thermocatellispora tengchongensis TaxID=1073253 RepID=A0A840PQ78_9ACTN|nr:DUF4082 domain-containing protein [Thermocatellispora tengchongensis]MBB5139900.1 methionine-rich copper-binding protein CopC [Thermocatellispora tengchongensis]